MAKYNKVRRLAVDYSALHTAGEITPVELCALNGLQGTRPALFKVSDALKNFKLAVDSQVDRLMSDYTKSPTLPLCGESKYEGGEVRKSIKYGFANLWCIRMTVKFA